MCVQLSSGGLSVMSLLVEVSWRRATLRDVFPALFMIFGRVGHFGDVRRNTSTNGRERRKSEATCVNTLGHMFVRGTL